MPLQAVILFAQEADRFFALTAWNESFRFNISTTTKYTNFKNISGGYQNDATVFLCISI